MEHFNFRISLGSGRRDDNPNPKQEEVHIQVDIKHGPGVDPKTAAWDQIAQRLRRLAEHCDQKSGRARS